jgi:hypothetical protein
VAAEKGFITQRVAARKHAIPRTRFGVNANSLSTA